MEFSESNVSRFVATHPEKRFEHLLTQVRFFRRNCFIPDPEEMTYDRIHVGANCPEANMPQLIELLNPGGILVTPFGDKLVQVIKNQDGTVSETPLTAVRYSDLVIPSEAEIKEGLLAVAKGLFPVTPSSSHRKPKPCAS